MIQKFESDGCSIPKWKWLRKVYPRIDYWAHIFYNECKGHDRDHYCRDLPRVQSTHEFYTDLLKKSYEHAKMECGGYDMTLFHEGARYAKLYKDAITYFGWIDWRIKKPLRDLVRRA